MSCRGRGVAVEQSTHRVPCAVRARPGLGWSASMGAAASIADGSDARLGRNKPSRAELRARGRLRGRWGAHTWRLHTRMVLSFEALATSVLSEEITRMLITSAWPRHVCSAWPVVSDQICAARQQQHPACSPFRGDQCPVGQSAPCVCAVATMCQADNPTSWLVVCSPANRPCPSDQTRPGCTVCGSLCFH